MEKILSKEEWKRRKQLIEIAKRIAVVVIAAIILLLIILGLLKVVRNLFGGSSKEPVKTVSMKQELNITEYFLSVNDYSRPKLPLNEVKGIVFHYVSNAGASAVSVRNYYEGLKETSADDAESSHFIIDTDGTIIQCIPLDEMACASGARNKDTISVTFCHEKIDGEPSDEAYSALVDLTVYLCKQYKLSKDDLIRHSDINGETCPKYFAEQEQKWAAFRAEVGAVLEKGNNKD